MSFLSPVKFILISTLVTIFVILIFLFELVPLADAGPMLEGNTNPLVLKNLILVGVATQKELQFMKSCML